MDPGPQKARESLKERGGVQFHDRHVADDGVTAAGGMHAARSDQLLTQGLRFAQMLAVAFEELFFPQAMDNRVVVKTSPGPGAHPESGTKVLFEYLGNDGVIRINACQIAQTAAHAVIAALLQPSYQLQVIKAVVVDARPMFLAGCFGPARNQHEPELRALELRRNIRRLRWPVVVSSGLRRACGCSFCFN